MSGLIAPRYFQGTGTRILPWLGMGACVAVLAAYLAWDLVAGRRKAPASTTEAQAAAAGSLAAGPDHREASPSATMVAFTDAKLSAAGISIGTARYQDLPTELGVPGRIEVDADHRVEIRPRASGVVRAVHASLGQRVKTGDALLTLDSADVGTARLNLRARQRELNMARIEGKWKSEVAETVALLIPEISKGTDPAAIEKEFADKPLGAYRGTLLQAYAEFDIAAHEEEKTAGLRRQQVIGEHPALVALHTRQGLQARLYATIEQVKYDAAQAKRMADLQVRRSESDVIDAAKRLRILGVYEDPRELLDHADRADAQAVDEDVTVYEINSPFAGTILQKNVVPSQKVELNDLMYTVADLTTVWVTANISEADLASVPKIRGGGIRFSATAYGAKRFPAELLSVGVMVDPQTRTVPLLARTDNREGLLVPGMFVHMSLDSPTSERVLTVPHGGVVEIEGKSGVFVPVEASAPDLHAFAFRAIQTGRDAGELVVVRSGLKDGDSVVATGAYQLKSELLLQNDADED